MQYKVLVSQKSPFGRKDTKQLSFFEELTYVLKSSIRFFLKRTFRYRTAHCIGGSLVPPVHGFDLAVG